MSVHNPTMKVHKQSTCLQVLKLPSLFGQDLFAAEVQALVQGLGTVNTVVWKLGQCLEETLEVVSV